MAKDHLRDYCTAAFKFYADNGKSSDKYINKMYKLALESWQHTEGTYGISKPTENALIRAEIALDEKVSEIMDMKAVEMTIARIQKEKDGIDIVKAIDHVYFHDGKTNDKVHRVETLIPASERTIYYWLKKARNIFAEERGLRK